MASTQTQYKTNYPSQYRSGYTLRKTLIIFFMIYTLLWIAFIGLCITSLVFYVGKCKVQSGSIVMGDVPAWLKMFLPIDVSWDSVGNKLEYSFNTITTVAAVVSGVEILFILLTIILVCLFKSPRMINDKYVRAIKTSFDSKPQSPKYRKD